VRLAAVLALVCAFAACSKTKARQLDLDAIEIVGTPHLRTDTVGDGKFTDTSSFVLVDAKNNAEEGAYVTLAGSLTDDGDQVVGTLNPQSLWIPAHEIRTFAIIDSERKPRPASTSATILVRGAFIPKDPPRTAIEELKTYQDGDHLVVQGFVVNQAPRVGNLMVIASFHDKADRPLTRPFSMVPVGGNEKKPVQFVGPPGSVRGTIYVGDVVY
jgi:uncharacterized protein YdeI (BOF family)